MLRTLVTRPRWLVRAVAVALVATMAASGCGGNEADPVADAVADTEPSDDATVDAATSGPEEGDRTLDDYLGNVAGFVRGGRGFDARSFDPDQLQRQQSRVEAEIQGCMQAQGFEYVPETDTTGLRFFAAATSQTISARDYAETEGFGISTAFDELFSGDIDLTEGSSPNDDYLATLSEGEADAWLFALNGEPPERDGQGRPIDPDTGEVIEGRFGQGGDGCRGQAQEAVRGDDETIDALAEAYAELEERMDGDTRLTELNRAWADCMLDGGFDYGSIEDARADIQSRLRPFLIGLAQGAFGPGSGADDAPGGAGSGQGPGAILSRIVAQGLTDEQDLELRQLQDLEIATAVAAYECGVDDEAEIAEIVAGYEAEFVATNRSLLESIAD